MNRRLVAFVVLLHFWCVGAVQSAYALSQQQESLNSAFSKADLVVSVRLREAKEQFIGRTKCGTRYSGLVLRVLENDLTHQIKTKRILSFGRAEGLQPGHEYLLFLKYTTNAKRELRNAERRARDVFPGWNGSGRSKQQDLALVTCRGLIPGFQYDTDAAWPVQYGGVYVFGLWPEASIPSSVEVEYHNGPQWILRSSDVFQYLQRLASDKTDGVTRR